MIINGLLNAINRSDLADRSVIISMLRIEEQRCTETELWERFEAQRSQIFGPPKHCFPTCPQTVNVEIAQTRDLLLHRHVAD